MGGGSAGSSAVAVPITNFDPVDIGGIIITENVGNGGISQKVSSKATGGSFGLSFFLLNLD